MKIIELRASYFKRLTAVMIRPDGALVPIAGRNAQGKSSVLDAIWVALGGTSVADREPIKHGQSRAEIKLDLGDLIVTRTFKRAGDGISITPKLTVESAAGKKLKEPQTILNDLVSGLSFDPLNFESAKPEERFDMVRGLLPKIDFDAIDKANKDDAEKRTEVNRLQKSYEAQAQAIPADMGVIGHLIDIDALTIELMNAGQHNAQIEQRAQRRRATAREAEDLRVQAGSARRNAERLRKEADALDERADNLDASADDLDTKLEEAEPLPEPVDVQELHKQIIETNKNNAKIADRDKRLELWKQAKEQENLSERLTDQIEARKIALRDQIAAAEFPVSGISFEGREVYLNGVPFEQASDAERLRASIEIAMALNPKLRVIRVREGSRLDEDNLALLGRIAEEHDFQVWCERVGDTGGKNGIVIVDGHIQGQDPDEVLAMP